MINNVVEMGRLTDTPELRTTTNGISVCRFSIAIERPYIKEGEQEVDFISCVAWRGTAEFISKFFKKGSMIAIIGSLRQNKFTDKDGNKRSALEVSVESASFTGEKKSTENEKMSDEVKDDETLVIERND